MKKFYDYQRKESIHIQKNKKKVLKGTQDVTSHYSIFHVKIPHS